MKSYRVEPEDSNVPQDIVGLVEDSFRAQDNTLDSIGVHIVKCH